ncbi:MAG: PDZ domain-containing protein [Anaerolineales bacterium]|nr:PDZ domain-containing protein [Anaerolineales bacterium]
MRTFLRSFLSTLLVVLILAAAFLAGYIYRDHRPAGVFPILSQAYTLLRQHGYDDPPPDPALEYGMIRGMIQAYGDPYTSFSEPAQTELQSNDLSGSFGGIGARIGTDEAGFRVLYPFAEGPAAKAGILEGDRLLQVDDLPITAESSTEAMIAAIRGEVGTRVRLTVARPPGYERLEFEVERAEIALPSVTWHLEPDEPRLGIIEVNVIADTTPDEIEKAVADLQGRGAQYYALDLRDNYGGLLEAGIATARLFLTPGDLPVIEQQYRGQEVESFEVEEAGPLSEIPLVVLVNENTASAAEIIAGSLQAQGRALLIGVPTYGKDTIQLVFGLDDGSSLHITAAHWWVPGLAIPHGGNGLQPDLPPLEGAADGWIAAAVAELVK